MVNTPFQVDGHVDHLLDILDLKFIETNEDVSRLVDLLVSREETRCIVMACALCDFEPRKISWIEEGPYNFKSLRSFGKDQPRLSSKYRPQMDLIPTDKLIGKIRKNRKDIFLVGFKTTAGESPKSLYDKGLKLLKDNSCNLVLGNDIQTHLNMIITPEEFPYTFVGGKGRDEAIDQLCEMVIQRTKLSFSKTEVTGTPDQKILPATAEGIPENFVPVLRFLIENNAFKLVNGRTTGHFGCVYPEGSLSSVRYANHNKVFEEGMVRVTGTKDGVIQAIGSKPSAGEHTQQEIYRQLGDRVYSVVHFHCPLSKGIILPMASQKPFECGSHQCATNTVNAMEELSPGVYVCHLEGHGPNIAFHKDVPAYTLIFMIRKFWDLSKGLSDHLED